MRCLVIEDDLETSGYICSGLKNAGYLTEACGSGEKGLDRALGDRWDIVILDRLLPGNVDGLSIVHEMRGRGIHTPILILSALNSIDERVRGLRSGSDDYLSKPFALSELLARVEVLTRRAQAESESGQLTIADLVLDLSSLRVTRNSRVILLQKREFRLLEYLLRHQGQVVTRSMLLQAVWDYHFDPQTNVIDVQISRLRNKIDKGCSPALIHTIRGVGYRLAVQKDEAAH